MSRYIIEIGAGKIFSYEVTGVGEQIRCRLLKPHGDKFHSAKDHWAYWDWFEAETAVDELDACFICPEDERQILKHLRSAAQIFKQAEHSTWLRSELKKFFATYRDEPTQENFTLEVDACRLTFDGGKIFLLAGLSTFALTDDAPPAEKTSPTPKKTKFKVKVYQPPAQSTPPSAVPPETNSESEQNIPQSSAEPVESQEKISAEDLRSYIDKQTNEQCAGVSFKS